MIARIIQWFQLRAQRRFSLRHLAQWPNLQMKFEGGNCAWCSERLFCIRKLRTEKSLSGETFLKVNPEGLATLCLRCQTVWPFLYIADENGIHISCWHPEIVVKVESNDFGRFEKAFALPAPPEEEPKSICALPPYR